MTVTVISPAQLHDLLMSGERIDLIDVRTPAEYREVHVEIARNVPLETLNCESVLKGRSGDDPLYVICRSGSRGRQACEKIIAAGCSNVVNVEGGTLAWDQAGFPVVRGKKAFSLERQVRIAAGFMALVGAVLAVAHHRYWAGVSGFVGAGLMHAGITDTCAMAMILARMPWNQAGKSDSTGSVKTCTP
ncbi:MAG: rhodanese-like domain-containing protein [Planctomycetaceae bacterium]